MLQQLHDFLIYWDYTIWYTVNTEWHNTFLDATVPFLRNQWFWVPLYLFLLLFMPLNFGKRGWFWCLGFILCFALSDYISASLIKPFFHRVRPCNNPFLIDIVHTLVPCGSGYSFPSSHASNHFSMGVYSAITLQKRVKWIWIVPIVWAMLVSFAQVYVGVHYPLDVTCGAFLGAAIGSFVAGIYNRRYSLALVT